MLVIAHVHGMMEECRSSWKTFLSLILLIDGAAQHIN